MEFMWTGTSQRFNLLFLFVCWFGLVWFGLVCLFVCLFFCLFVFLFVCLSNSKSLQISYFKALRNFSKNHWYFTRFMHFFVFFEHVQSAETSSFPVKPTGCPAHRCLSTLPPWSCHLPSGLTGGLEEGAASRVFPFVFERKDQHVYILYIFFIINTRCILKYIYIYVGWIHIYIYTYAFYTFFVMYTSCDMVYIYMMYLYIYIYLL